MLAKNRSELEKQNREILWQIVFAVEFQAKQGLSFIGHEGDKVNFTYQSINSGNFIDNAYI